MSRSTGPVLMIGAITMGNEVVLHSQPFDWKVPIATGIAALVFAGLEQISPELAVGLAWVGLVAVLFTRLNPAVPAPAESLASTLSGKKTSS
jgi:hypothetical protein